MKRSLLLISLVLSVLLAGCKIRTLSTTGGGYSGGGSGFGATQGGLQDMGFVRELIANGRVPPAEAFLVEGMFSEHDLPLEGAACSNLLCLRSALGIAPVVETDGDSSNRPSAWMQVGMSSTIDPETYQRPGLTLIATVDVSGSMGWDYSDEQQEYPVPGFLARMLLKEIVAELNSDDQIAIVTFGTDARTALSMTRGDNHNRIIRVIDSFTEKGSTNMEAGLERSLAIARASVSEKEQTRIMLFTDEQPNVGATSPTAFSEIVSDAAGHGIGVTVMGVGLGLGQEVMNAMVRHRGGNAFSLFTGEDVNELLENDWPWLVSPIAYDLSITLKPSTGFTIVQSYGFPENDGAGVSLDLATVFLSGRRGALLIRLEPEHGDAFHGLTIVSTITYETLEKEDATEKMSTSYQGQPLDDRGMYFEQHSVEKSVALAVLVSGMRDAAEIYGTDQSGAVTIMRTVVDRIIADARSIDDAALDPEVELARDLLVLMENGAEQGDMYGL